MAPVAVLLKVTSEGGFINPAANLNALPIVEVLTDGRILTPGAVDLIAPGPLLPTVDVRDTGPTGAAAILAAIKQAGLDQPSTARPGVPGDSGTDIFAVTIDGQTTETRLTGNGPGGTWRSGPLAPADRYERAFALPGTYDYVCTVHPEMRGRLVVQP